MCAAKKKLEGWSVNLSWSLEKPKQRRLSRRKRRVKEAPGTYAFTVKAPPGAGLPPNEWKFQPVSPTRSSP